MLKERCKYNSSLSRRKPCHMVINHRSRSLRIVQKKHFQFHRGSIIEKDIKLSYISEISIYLSNFFFLYINDFRIAKNQGAFWILSSIFFKTVKKAETRKTKKAWSCDDFFHFQTFEIFGSLWINFSINWNKCFWVMINSFRITLRFWHTIKQIWTMPLQRCHTNDSVWHVSIAALGLLSNNDGILSQQTFVDLQDVFKKSSRHV